MERILLDCEKISIVIDRLALELKERFNGVSELALVGIHRRGVPLAQRLKQKLKQLNPSFIILEGRLDITLYRDDIDLKISQPIVRQTDIAFDISDKYVVIVDDVLYTGRTTRAALDAITDLGRPKIIELLVLIERDGREFPISAQFIGKKANTSSEDYVQVHLKEIDGEDSVRVINYGKPARA